MQKLLLSLMCIILADAYDRALHRNETFSERFRFGDYDFVFYGKEANWDEAFTICKATHSRLAVVHTPERAKFLAEALSQTKVGFEDVWIGGRFLKDRWRWAATGRTFSRRTKDFPPWLSYPTQRGKNCLSLDRRNHDYPLFVEKKCSIFRGFVCEESISHALDNFPEEGNEIIINDRQYLLYHARVTWDEAVAFCKQIESQLATIPDLDTARKLVARMKRTRPALENAWIGARKNFLNWVWVATEESLATEVKDGFPPWKTNGNAEDMKDCLLLDHHPCLKPLHITTFRIHECEEPIFLDEVCDLKKDFVCETVIEEKVPQERSNLVTVEQITYIFFEEPLSWASALLACENIKMTLAQPQTPRQWETIITHMGDMEWQFDHVWLGGKWLSNEWVWINENHSIPLPNPNETYPPWCSSLDLHEDNESCLNLDRDAHNIAVIYGFNCSVKQGFVCQLEASDAVETPDQSFASEYQHKSSGMTHFEAYWDCKSSESHLAVANNMQIATNLGVIIPRDTLVWVDGKRINSIWKWTETNETIPDNIGPDGYPPWESTASTIGQNMCLAMKAGYRDQPFFVEKPCNEKLDHLCHAEHRDLPQPDLILDMDSIKYFFYKDHVSWNQAMAICNSGNLHLVNVGNLKLANFLLNGMRDDNPQWTSGKELIRGNWSWITSNSELPKEIKNGYPPWLNNTIPNNAISHCLMLNKSSDLPKFIAENCSELHSFVCANKIFISNETTINLGNITISVGDNITSIAKAKQQCLDNGKNVIDFSKLSKKELLTILQMEKVKSLWVDVIYDSEGKWVYRDTLEEFKTDIDFPQKNNDSKNHQNSCLTLQVTVEHKLILVPTLCSDFSRIVCMTVKNKAAAPPKMENVINDSVTITAVLENTKFSDSKLVCNDQGGEIINRLLLKTATDYFKTLHHKYKKFWLGAYLVNGSWMWDDNTPVEVEGLPEIKLEQNQTVGNNCLIYNRKIDKMEAANCFDKYSTVCEQVVFKCDPLSTAGQPSVQWSPEKCTKERLSAGTVCHAQCPRDSNLVGPELHVCTKGKWSYNKLLSCRTDNNHAPTLANLIEKQINAERIPKSTFLFVIDNGLIDKKGFERSNYEQSLKFAKHLADTMLLNDNRQVGIELYNYNAKIIDKMESNSCYLHHTIERLSKSTRTVSRNLPNYYMAFITAEKELLNKNVGSVFLFFFAMRPDRGPVKNRTEIVQKFKERGITIIVITVGNEINRSQLEEIASTKYDGLQLYSFKTLKGLHEASKKLKKKSKVKPQVCPKENIDDQII